MREIEVDIDVFATIWSHRKQGENNENQIIKRIFKEWETLVSSPIDTGVAPYTSMKNESLKEVNTSIEKSKKIAEMGKIRWVDDIQACLVELGGSASLHRIYQAVERKRLKGGRSLPKTLEAVIRRTLEDHSSDSANFRSTDLFALVGRGEWALRSTLTE